MSKKLAICGGDMVRETPFAPWPVFDEKEMGNLNDVLSSRVWGAGPRGNSHSSKVGTFGQRFSQYHGVNYGLPVNNGTVSLEIGLKSGGVSYGDEVIVPAYTFFATAGAVLKVNAVPVFVDINPKTFCIDADLIEEALTPRTRAIVPVHIAGEFADMDRIMDVANKRGLFVLEDAAHAIGAVWRDRKAGSVGHAGSFSFQSAKTMTAGEGGAIITDSAELYDRFVENVAFGRRENRPVFEHHISAGNQRMSEFQAAVLLAQFERLDSQIALREKNANFLTARLSNFAGVTPQARDERTRIRGYFWYLLEYDPEYFGGISRDRFVQALNAEGIPCSAGYNISIPRNPVFTNERYYLQECPWVKDAASRNPNLLRPNCARADRLANRGIALPHYTLLGKEQDVEDIVLAMEKIKTYINELL